MHHQVSFAFMYTDLEVLFFLPIDACKCAKHNEVWWKGNESTCTTDK